jgi:hypothetical protein
MVRGGKKLSISLIVRNLYFLLRILPFAAVKARHHLNIAVEESRARDIPAQLVKGLYDLGLLNETQNRFEEARNCYEEAHSVANAIDADTIKRDIETRLAVI